jgi:hypothetical protein
MDSPTMDVPTMDVPTMDVPTMDSPTMDSPEAPCVNLKHLAGRLESATLAAYMTHRELCVRVLRRFRALPPRGGEWVFTLQNGDLRDAGPVAVEEWPFIMRALEGGLSVISGREVHHTLAGRFTVTGRCRVQLDEVLAAQLSSVAVITYYRNPKVLDAVVAIFKRERDRRVGGGLPADGWAFRLQAELGPAAEEGDWPLIMSAAAVTDYWPLLLQATAEALSFYARRAVVYGDCAFTVTRDPPPGRHLEPGTPEYEEKINQNLALIGRFESHRIRAAQLLTPERAFA